MAILCKMKSMEEEILGITYPFAANKNSTAILTATPFSTCCKMMEWSESATSLVISTPRLMGPGCMITIFLSKESSNWRLMPKYWEYSRKVGKYLMFWRSN